MSVLRRLAVESREEHAPPRASATLSRRDALTAAAMAAGSSLVRCRPARAGEAHGGPRIAIIGGGIAGLNAALTLHDVGIASTVYEAGQDVGGRMRSNTSGWGPGASAESPGQVTEWCGEFIDTGHKAMLALADRFGLARDDAKSAEAPGSSDTYFFDGGYYSGADAKNDFAPVHAILAKQNEAAPSPTSYRQSTAEGRLLDHMSVYEWIERYVPGGHRSKLGALFEIAYTIEYGRDTREQSSLNAVYLLGGSTADLTLFGASDERYRIHGGNQRLPRAIAGTLDAGTLRLGHRLTRIARRSDGACDLQFDSTFGPVVEVADHVILAIPFSVLRRVDLADAGFDALKTRAIRELGYGTNAKLHVEFSDRLWQEENQPWPRSTGSSFSDTGYQNAWDASRAQPGKSGILVNFTGGALGASLSGETPYASASSPRVASRAAQFVSQIARVFPGLDGKTTGRATLSTPASDPLLLGSYACWLVGQVTLFGGYEGVRQGPIHFAGEHCSMDNQGFMEGAAVEGARAATEILGDLGAMPRSR